MKQKLKNVSLIRKNYRKLRKIFLHIINGRFNDAIRLINHYNPFYRFLLLTPYRLHRMQKKKLHNLLDKYYFQINDDYRQKNIKIGLVVRDGDDFPKSSAFIRLLNPLTTPGGKKIIGLKLYSPKKINFNIKHDVMIVQRTAFDNYKQVENFITNVRKRKIRLIVDNDDYFHKIPKSHPEFKTQLKRIDAFDYLVSEADQLWISTEKLILSEHKDKSVVIKNSLDRRLWNVHKNNAGSRLSADVSSPIKIVYMGTSTHDNDFSMILTDLDKLHAKSPGSFSLTAIGVSSNVPQRTWINQINPPRFESLYPTFVNWFLEQGPFDIGLSPLVNNEFNNSKSDIKCLDYIAAGILPVVSDIAPYQSKEISSFIVKVRNEKGMWFEQLSEIVRNKEKFRIEKKQKITKAQKYLWSVRSSTKTIRLMLDKLNELN